MGKGRQHRGEVCAHCSLQERVVVEISHLFAQYLAKQCRHLCKGIAPLSSDKIFLTNVARRVLRQDLGEDVRDMVLTYPLTGSVRRRWHHKFPACLDIISHEPG